MPVSFCGHFFVRYKRCQKVWAFEILNTDNNGYRYGFSQKQLLPVWHNEAREKY